MWGGILYIIAGLLVGYWYWEIHYAKEYNLAKSIKETDDAAVCLFLLFLTIFWPIVFCIIIYEKIKKCCKKTKST